MRLAAILMFVGTTTAFADGTPTGTPPAVYETLAQRRPEITLPAYTPELNPTERLWPLVKEGVANRAHDTLAALEQEVCGRCQRITAAQVTALTNYHWWPTA